MTNLARCVNPPASVDSPSFVRRLAPPPWLTGIGAAVLLKHEGG